MAQINLGRILPIFKGWWDIDTEYEKLDIVYYGGSSWVATRTNRGVYPDSEDGSWIMICKAGSLEGLTEEQIQEFIIGLGTVRMIEGNGTYNEF